MHQKPTMKDVARLAGVGTMTVSRVLSGRFPSRREQPAAFEPRWQNCSIAPMSLRARFAATEAGPSA